MTRAIGGITAVYGLAAMALALIAVSLAGTLVGSFAPAGEVFGTTLSNFARVAADQRMPGIVGRTIQLGLGTVAVMMAVALPLAWILGRTDFRWKTALFAILAAKLAIPGFITAMAYVWLLNPSSGLVNQILGRTSLDGAAAFDIYHLGWICLLQGLVTVPGAVFMLLPAIRNLDASLEEAALTSGVPRAQVFLRIVIPLLTPAVLAVAVFYFIIAVEMFDFVAIIGFADGGEVLVLRIYRALIETGGLPEYGLAGVFGLILFALCLGAIILYVRLLRDARRFAVVGGKRRMMAPVRLGRWHGAATALCIAWFTLTVALPVVTLIWVTLTPFFQPPSRAALATLDWVGFADGFSYLGEPAMNTLGVMIGAMIVAISFAIALSWVVTRSRSRMAPWADAAVFLAPAVPTVVSATAFQVLGIALYQWLPLYGTLWLMIAAMGTRMTTYCSRTLNGAALQLAPELEEAAWASGLSQWAAFRAIFVPLMAPAIFYSAMMVGMLAARDLTLPLVMGGGRTPLVSTLIFDLQTNGEYNSAAAVALYMILVLVALALAARRMTGLGEQGADAERGR
jgi:iron(III) transport system permease protein